MSSHATRSLSRGDPLALLEARIKEQEELLRSVDGQLAALGSESDALRVEEVRIRSGDIKFLPERVASLRVRQVRCAMCLAQAAMLYRLELETERGLLAEYDEMAAVKAADRRALLVRAKASKHKAEKRLGVRLPSFPVA
jgi:hypothetical protein